ncbi:AMP dependent ligase, putative [Paecilomyces variotii No. 5]|uniref:AMP dependent ligase, putative n=1 Tax=Byssochlamys spectabilis (strain No. 5 / NBRC 109023) TaxID=1356009 RepID=V5GDK9_BYSSN|nr:AMP dependent ligase, putative [Paecilomyces variotii No. 5]
MFRGYVGEQDDVPRAHGWRSSDTFIISTMSLALFTDELLFAFMIPLLPALLEQRIGLEPSLTQKYTSIFLTEGALVSIVSSPFIGSIADAVSSKKTLLLTLLVLTLISIGSLSLTTSLVWLYLGRFFQCIVSHALWIVGMATLAENIGSEQMGKVSGLTSTLSAGGTTFGPLLAGLLFHAGGYWCAWAGAAAFLLLDIIMRLVMKEKPVKFSRADENGERDPLISNHPPSADGEQCEPSPSSDTRGWRFHIHVFRQTRFSAGVYCAYVFALLIGCFESTLAVHVRSTFGWGALHVGMLLAMIQGPGMVLAAPVGLLKDRIGSRIPTTVGFLSLMPFIILSGTAGDNRFPLGVMGSWGKTLYAVCIGAIGCLTCLLNGAGSIEATETIDILEAREPGKFGSNGGYSRAIAVTSMTWMAGLMTGPFLAQFVIESYGYFELQCFLEHFLGQQNARTFAKSLYSSQNAGVIDLSHYWQSEQKTMGMQPVKESTFLKAAWILTLHCFRPEEVIQMSYEEGSLTGPTMPAIFTARVKPDWNVRSLLEILEVPSPSLSYAARLSQLQSPSSVCTSALRYLTVPEETLIQPSSGNGKIDTAIQLIVVRDANQIQVSIKNSEQNANSLNESMLWTFQYVLRQITTHPLTLKLHDIDFCSEWHRRKIQTLTYTDSASKWKCLHDIILENCQLHPTKLAVRSFDGDLTYRELDDLSLRLAHYLIQLGVQPETFVLSSFQKSTWAIVARLAILRAGGAYISIHSSNPPVYLSSVIQRTGAKVMLSDPTFADQFRNTIEKVVTVTPSWLRDLPSASQPVPCPSVQPSNACTVLFTSGSTGRPKAIVQEHRAYASAIRDYARNFGLNEDTRFLHYDDYAFDISNLEFLVPLIVGGYCCVPGPMKTVQDLARNIQMLNANIAFLTPTVAIKANPEDMNNLKILCVGGEPLPKDLLNNWAGSSTRLINQFGMGEAAVCCAYNDNVYDPNSSPATIGKPSSGAIWIVDQTDPTKLMPIGAVGEIVIEGPHLSRGYLDQDHQAPDRTKPAGFLEQIPCWLKELHPDRRSPRLYRSGDLARWTHDGLIEYIGRKDTIVKLDGCRIDVIEVEHLSRKSLTPKDAIVVDLLGVIDGKEDPCLAAFLYLSDHPDNSETAELCLKDASHDPVAFEKVAQIKEVLAAHLPLYMIPTLFLLGTRVPRTPSKKTDRRMIRLLSQNFYSQERERRSSSPSHPAEAQLLPP